MRVITDELGYGGNPVAKMNGVTVSQDQSYPICEDFYGNYTLSCTSGMTVAGWRRYWILDGYQSGYFTYQNTSLNSPWNTMSDAISIQ